MINSYSKKQKGFTLVEAIIYVALFVMLSTLLVDSLFIISRAYNDSRINRNLLNSAHVSVERMTREIRGANSWVSGDSSVFGFNPGKLTIKFADTTTETFELSGGVILFTDKTGVTSNLTANNVNVDSLIFQNISTLNGSAVKFDMTLTSLGFSPSKTISISDTVVLRGSY